MLSLNHLQLLKMSTIGALCLGLLIATAGVVSFILDDKFSIIEELERLRIEEEIDMERSVVPSWFTNQRDGKVLVNVDSFGAIGDGISDDTKVHGLSNWCSRSL